MNRIQLILSKLKPKVKAFGFNQKELKGVAAKIADNLKSEEDASDEDLNAEIDSAIDAIVPYLELGRSYANRVINDRVNQQEEGSEVDDSVKPQPKSKSVDDKKSSDSAIASLIDAINGLKADISTLKGEKVADTRRAKLESMLKDTGTFGVRTLKSFSRMKFDSDDEFEEFCSEIEADLKAFNQERANAGLAKLGTPAISGTPAVKDKEPNVLTDDEVRALASFKS